MRNILNEHIPDRCIGHGSPISPVPLSWPTCSPNLTTLTTLCGPYQGINGCELLLQERRVVPSCGMGVHHYYTTNALAHVTENIMMHLAVFQT